MGCTAVPTQTAPTQTTEAANPTIGLSSTLLPKPSPTPPEELAESETSSAADADVIYVVATETAANVWSFSVTVAHPDTGWEDYADGWDVVLPDGTVLLPNSSNSFTRLLLHPHENEQPFTRSQSNIQIPSDVTEVTVRAHDLVDGFGGEEVIVDLTAVSGDKFEVKR